MRRSAGSIHAATRVTGRTDSNGGIREVKLGDLHTRKVVFANSRDIFREQYQVNQNTSELFQEDEPAIERLSRDLAHTLVTQILENS